MHTANGYSMLNKDKKLNTVYKQKITALKKSKRDKLQKLQRPWIAKKESSYVADEANYNRERGTEDF